jgi:hypothetical protein
MMLNCSQTRVFAGSAVRTGDGRRALRDAVRCKILRPKWAKAYFRKGQALMLMKVRPAPVSN